MHVEGNTKLEAELRGFSTTAKRVQEKCNTEAQTKATLVNPYLKILGYDIHRNPEICRLEYPCDTKKSGPKEAVDYAIMGATQPVILIEAKSATNSMSNKFVPDELQKYFRSENAVFGVYTNGLIWQWYRERDKSSKQGKQHLLEEAPFLVHDVRELGKDELPFLRSVLGPDFNIEGALALAKDLSLAKALTKWIDNARRNPSDGLLSFIISELKIGNATAAQKKKVRNSFVPAFNAYVEGTARAQHRAKPERQRQIDRPPEHPSKTIRAKKTDGGVAVKEAMYRSLVSIGSDGGVKSKAVLENAEKTFNQKFNAKTARNALWFLKKEGKARSESGLWFPVNAPPAENP